MAARHARTRRPSRGATAAVIVLTIATGAVSNSATDWWPPTGPFVTSGDVGERIEVPPVSVVVHGVRAGTLLVDFGADDGLTTDGVWIAVDVTAEALSEPSNIGEFALRDERGRSYRQSNRVSNDMVGRAFDPGISERGDVVFELPRDALDGLVLVVSPDAPGRVAPRAAAEVALTIGGVGDEPVEPRSRELAS